jgi:putative ABC transport system substrate-binding protein
MRRRDVLALVGGAAALAPLVTTHAQQTLPKSGQAPLIGYLTYFSPGPNPIGDGIVGELRRLGWSEGETVAYKRRYGMGDSARLPAFAAELVARRVDLILAPSPPAAAAVQRATRSIPIVALADDMQASGLVASVARPDGTMTGVSIFASELDAKRLALLTELVPKARRIAGLAESIAGPSVPQLRGAARELGIELVMFEAGSEAKIEPALDAIAAFGSIDAVIVLASVVLHNGRRAIIARMEAAHLPAIYQWPEYASAEGALIAYGPQQALVARLVAEQVDRVLRGASVAELPVVQPTKFNLVINTRIVRQLDLAVPAALLARADEVIE